MPAMKDVHYRLIAQAIAALVPSGEAHVLDYGSGKALHADLVAEATGKLLLCEAAPGVRAGLEKRFDSNPKRFKSLPRMRLRGCRSTRSI